MASSYKTTVASAISAAASFVLFSQQLHLIQFPNWAMAIALFASVGGLAAFGVVSKDYNATGGTNPVTPEAKERVQADAGKSR